MVEQTGIERLSISRRNVLKLIGAAGAMGLSPLLAACGDDESDVPSDAPGTGADATATAEPDASAAATEEPNDLEPTEPTSGEQPSDHPMGGTGRVALYSEPPTLDSMWTTAIIVLVPSQHIFEYLFAYDSQWDNQPMLTEGFEISDDGLEYTFDLRQGIMFHNGEEMDADDVVASLMRWTELSGDGQSASESITDISAIDDYTVQISLSQPLAPLLAYLTGPGGGGAIIMPADIAEATGSERLSEYVGTGPFEFVEHIPDRHIKMKRFESYTPRDEPPDAYSGRRVAYLDELEFITVPDAAARIAGVEAGDYHWAEEVTRDEHERLSDSDRVEAIVIKPLRSQNVVFNKAQGPMTDVRLRKAVQLAIDHEEMMAAAFGPSDFWRLQPSVMPPESVWYTDAGSENYNPQDIEAARSAVEGSDYDGETIRWMGPADREDYFAVGLAGVQMLRDIGLNAELVSMDWGSLVDRRTNPEEYEIFNTGFTFTPEPTTLSFIPDDWPGWWESEAKNEILERLNSETNFETRMDIWEEFQLLVYEEVPIVMLGDFFGLSIKRKEFNGESLPVSSFPIFWNMWIDQN